MATLAIGLLAAGPAYGFTGRVVDAASKEPIAGATVRSGNESTLTGTDGSFQIRAGDTLSIKAVGHYREERKAATLEPHGTIGVRPIRPKAVFLGMASLIQPAQIESVLALPARSGVNALVIDVKNKEGAISLPGSLRDDLQIPARLKKRSAAISRVIARAKAAGLYTIARVAAFEDDLYGRKDADAALTSAGGQAVAGPDLRAWMDPRKDAVRAYVVSVALAAARAGFDEVQFDYVRFPADGGPGAQLSQYERRATVRGFLRQARMALAPYNVFVGADLFGYASWAMGDMGIGQDLSDVAEEVDYICPMLYPSLFKQGLPGIAAPLDHADKIVALSLARAQQRTGLKPIRFRPWLQGFVGEEGVLDGTAILSQTGAADAFGSDGWMIWHPRSRFLAERLPAREDRKISSAR